MHACTHAHTSMKRIWYCITSFQLHQMSNCNVYHHQDITFPISIPSAAHLVCHLPHLHPFLYCLAPPNTTHVGIRAHVHKRMRACMHARVHTINRRWRSHHLENSIREKMTSHRDHFLLQGHTHIQVYTHAHTGTPHIQKHTHVQEQSRCSCIPEEQEEGWTLTVSHCNLKMQHTDEVNPR